MFRVVDSKNRCKLKVTAIIVSYVKGMKMARSESLGLSEREDESHWNAEERIGKPSQINC